MGEFTLYGTEAETFAVCQECGMVWIVQGEGIKGPHPLDCTPESATRINSNLRLDIILPGCCDLAGGGGCAVNHEAIVMAASTTPSAKCWGKYKRVAVVVVDRDVLEQLGRDLPSSISDRARGVVRIVRRWENLNVGTTERCAYQRAIVEAQEIADKINGQIKKGEWS